MAFDAESQIGTDLDIVGAYQYSSAIAFDTNEYAHVQISCNSGGTTDSILASIQGSTDGTRWDDDVKPVYGPVFVDCTDGGDNDISFVIPPGLVNARVALIRSGSTDTIRCQVYVAKSNPA